jgi:hypothetical protein
MVVVVAVGVADRAECAKKKNLHGFVS